MFRKEKCDQILQGRELLRINSLRKSIPAKKRNAAIAIITCLYIIGLIFGKFINPDRTDQMLVWSLILTILYGTSILYFLFGGPMGQPLIITEKGLSCFPAVVETWNDLESYSWETFSGLSKVPGPTLFSWTEGVCLRLINKGMIQRNLDVRSGHSILATYLIFFNPDEIATADVIFSQHGLVKKELQRKS
jgi:hypothetical protein